MIAFELNQEYNLYTIEPTILGNEYKSMKLLSIMNLAQAVVHSDIHTVYQQLISVGVTFTNTDLSTMTFLLFQSKDGDKIVLAKEWIDLPNVIKVTTLNSIFTFTNISTDDKMVIEQALKELGYRNYTTQDIYQ